MKKIFQTLVLILALFAMVVLFIFFELPPFNAGGEPSSTTKPTPATNGENGSQANQAKEEQAATTKIPANATFNEYMKIGNKAFIAKDYVLAKVALTQALKKSPGNPQALTLLAKIFLGRREPGEAQRILDSASAETPSTTYYRGLLAAYTGDHEKAKNLLRSISTPSSQNVLAAYSEFDAYQGGTNEHLRTLLGRSFNQIEEYDLAILTLLDVIKENKNYRDAWTLLGYAYLKTAKYQDAQQSLLEAKKLDPSTPETPFYLGLSYLGLGDLNKAAQELEIAKKNGYQPAVQVEQKLAEIYLELKKYPEAAASYESIVSLNSEDISYFTKPIWIYLDQLKQPEKALALAHKAAAAHPQNAMSYNLLGWASIESNRLAEAQKYLDKARQLDPELSAIYLNYGLLAEKRGLFEKAVGYYHQTYLLGKTSSIGTAAATRYNALIGRFPEWSYPDIITATNNTTDITGDITASVLH